MIYNIEWIETKGADWKVATLREGIENPQTFTDVTINRNNKDGTLAWPAFDTFAPGIEIDGNLWKSPAGRIYLFANRPAPKNDGEAGARQGPRGAVGAAMATKAANIEKAQDRTAEQVKVAQDNKSNAIKVAAAMRDATLITIALMDEEDKSGFPASFERIKTWYLTEWEKTEKDLDLPF